jgi:hypothetical protein
LLYYLYGPGRANEHTDPHLVAAWAQGVRDPARDTGVTMAYLAALLDAPVEAMAQRRRPEKHVYHLGIRVAPQDRVLTDQEWAEIAREMVDAAGLAPAGDPRGVRWVAVRHAPDHIHIVATMARQDGRKPALHDDIPRMQARARQLEVRYGLRQLTSGDRTASQWLTRAELEKTERSGLEAPARTELGDLVRRAGAAAGSEEEFFALVEAAGVRVKVRRGQGGEATGYAVALPGDRTAARTAVWYSGSRLAPDLSLPRVRERWTGAGGATSVRAATGQPEPVGARVDRGQAWRAAAAHVHLGAAALARAGDVATAGELVALGDLLSVLGGDAPPVVRRELRAAARAFERAGRVPGPRVMDSPARTHLRSATALLTRTGRAGRGEDVALAVLLVALALVVAAAMRWHQRRGLAGQQEAAALAGWHLQAAVEVTRGAVAAGHRPGPAATRAAGAGPHTGDGGDTGVHPSPEVLAAGESVVRRVLPDLGERVVGEQAWPALAATLATVQGAGLDPAGVLEQVARRRGLQDARQVSEVLTWRLTRHLQRTAAADIPATSPVPAGVPRPRTAASTPPAAAEQSPGLVRCGDDPGAPWLADVVRAAVPEHAAELLADPAAPVLAQTLGEAREAGWDAGVLLTDVAATRGLDDAHSVAQVLTWRVQGWRHRQDAAAATTGSRTRAATPTQTAPTPPPQPSASPAAPSYRPEPDRPGPTRRGR